MEPAGCAGIIIPNRNILTISIEQLPKRGLAEQYSATAKEHRSGKSALLSKRSQCHVSALSQYKLQLYNRLRRPLH